jgi:hypothetical protein
VDYEEVAAEQHHCPEAQRLLCSTSLKLAFCQTDAQRLAEDVSTDNFCPIFPLKLIKAIFDHFHNDAYHGRLASRHIISSSFVWRGLSSDITVWALGVWPASGARSTATHAWPSSPSPSRRDVILTFMLIWWAHYNAVIILIIFSPSLITHPNGWKLFPFLIRPWQHSRNDHFRSQPHNLLQTFGLNCARCFTSPTNKQLLTILSRTEQSKGCTDASRTSFAHLSPRQLGSRRYLLCSSDSEHSQGKTPVLSRQKHFLALPLCCLMNFCKTEKCQLMLLSKVFKNFACSCCFFAQAQF